MEAPLLREQDKSEGGGRLEPLGGDDAGTLLAAHMGIAPSKAVSDQELLRVISAHSHPAQPGKGGAKERANRRYFTVVCVVGLALQARIPLLCLGLIRLCNWQSLLLEHCCEEARKWEFQQECITDECIRPTFFSKDYNRNRR